MEDEVSPEAQSSREVPVESGSPQEDEHQAAPDVPAVPAPDGAADAGAEEGGDDQVASFLKASAMPSRMREEAEVPKDVQIESFPRSAGVPSRMRDVPALLEGESDNMLGPVEGNSGPSQRARRSDAQGARSGLPAALYKVLQLYSHQVERRPRLLMLIFTILILALVAPLFRLPVIEFDFSTFIRADGDSMSRREAYLLALAERKGPNARRRLMEADAVQTSPWAAQIINIDGNQIEVLPPTENATDGGFRRLFAQLIYTKSMSILYDSTDGSIFGKQALQEVGSFEVGMRNLAGWKQLCSNSASSLTQFCDPGESLMAYAWATQEVPGTADSAFTRFVMNLDANGQEPIPVPAFLAYVEQGGHPVLDFRRYLPSSYVPPPRDGTGLEAQGKVPTVLRSRFWFAFDVTGTSQGEITGKVEQAKIDWQKFVATELYPYLLLNSDGINKKVYPRYAGDFLTSLELLDTLQSDLLFALGSVAFVLLCLWFQLQAVWLSFVSLFIILLSLPIAYVLTPAEKLTVTSFLALFLIVGIGSDTVFVYADIWEQEAHLPMEERIPTVLMSAGVNCLATSLTTSASFLANLASVLQPLREFGFFMGLCVLWCFVLITLYLPPLLVIQSRRKQKKVETEVVVVGVLPAYPAPEGPPPPRKKRKRCARLTRSYIEALARRVAFCPGVVLAVSFLMLGLFVLGIVLDIEVATGVPQVFPDNHNQVQYPILEAQFTAVPQVDVKASLQSREEKVCKGDAEWGSFSPTYDCDLFWCDADSTTSTTDDCWYSEISSSSGAGVSSLTSCASVSFNARVASPSRPETAPTETALQSMAAALGSDRYLYSNNSVAISELKTLVVESWSTGTVVTSRFFRLGSVATTLSAHVNGTQACSVQVVCSWNVPACTFTGYTALGSFAPSSRRLKATSRQLQMVSSPTVPTNKQIDITVVWGIRAPKTIPLLGPNAERWSYDPHFQMSNPWAQRAVMAMCEDEPPAELLIFRRRCFIQDLRSRLRIDSRRFPSRNFYNEVTYYSLTSLPMQEQLWIVSDSVAAVSLSFQVDFSYEAGAENILSFKEKWDTFVDGLNAKASSTGNMAWHTAQAWVQAEAEVAIINSTILTIVVAALGGFGCMLIFTLDPLLALLVLLLVIGVVTSLAFFMVVIMAWTVGPIEVISLVAFVGYSVTYSLHVAHIYGEANAEDDAEVEASQVIVESPDDPVPPPMKPPPTMDAEELTEGEKRKIRARKAMMRIGLSILSSTLSTVGASAFLLLSTMQIFTKLGFVVLVVSLLSCIASLVVLPAVLILCGPNNRSWHERCCGHRAKPSTPENPELGNAYEGGRGNVPVDEEDTYEGGRGNVPVAEGPD